MKQTRQPIQRKLPKSLYPGKLRWCPHKGIQFYLKWTKLRNERTRTGGEE